jgi:hypothetical protein
VDACTSLNVLGQSHHSRQFPGTTCLQLVDEAANKEFYLKLSKVGFADVHRGWNFL